MGFRLAAFADEAGPSVEEQIRALREERIPLVELRGVDGRGADTLSEQEAAALRVRLEENGLRVWSLGSPFGKTGIREPFGPAFDAFRRGLDVARALGTAHLRLFSFYIPAGEDPHVYRDEVMERLTRFAEAARGSGITLCHENEKGIYGDIAVRCEQIHRAVPELRAVFDPANFIQCGQETLAAWALLEPYVEYFHVKDAMPDGTVVPAGRGAGHLAELLRDYRGETLTLEPHLYDFSGLSSLEQDGARTQAAGAYGDARASFGAAAAALRALLEEIGRPEAETTKGKEE